MKQKILFFYDLIIYGNIWTAVNIAILPVISSFVLTIPYPFNDTLLLFLLSLLGYIWPALITVLKPNFIPETEKEQFIYNNHLLFKISTALLLISILLYGLYLKISYEYFKTLLPVIILLLTYIIPYKNLGNRKIPFLKTISISFCWAYISIIHLSLGKETIIFFIYQWIIFLLLTLPFDKRDNYIDIKVDIKTIENTLSIQSLLLLKCIIVLFSMVLVYYLGTKIYLVYSVSCIVLLIPYQKTKSYFILLDGLPLIQLSILYLFN